MKRTTVFILITSLILLAVPAMAEDGAALFKAKCAACHGPDGTKLAKANLSSAEVQGKTDADLVTFVGTNAKHNFKTKGLSDEQIKSVVTFLRTLKK
jgi:mono/diheme cytochrome c family protein